MPYYPSKKQRSILWDRSRRPEGGEWEPIKISSKFESSAYIPKSPNPSSVLTKVWSSYWRAKPTQKVSNQRTKTRSESEAKWENFRTDLPGPVWPVWWTGLTGRVCSKRADRSDRSVLPVWPVAPRKPPRKRIQTVNFEQTTMKSVKLGGLLRPYPVNISPKDLGLNINESRELWGRSKGIGVFSTTRKLQI